MNKKLKALKSFDIKHAQVTLWIVRRHLSEGEAHYKVLRAETGPKLRSRMKSILATSIDTCNALKEYEYITIDQDDDTLLLDAGDTDFSILLSLISNGSENDTLRSEEELIGAWGYVVEAQSHETYLFGFRQSSSAWTAKRTLGRTIIFNGRRLEEIDATRSFRLDNDLDFLCYNNELFVHDKSAFEKAMNFRTSFEAKRDAIVTDLTKHGILHNPEEVSRCCGSNMRYLRKLATVGKNGYYRDTTFIADLRAQNDAEGWGLKFEGEMIVVEEEKLPLLLTLLNNDRLKSPITRDLFDVSHKIPV